MSSFPEHLLEGYRAFASQRLPTEQSRYRELSELGQSPDVMVIGCCDSRVSPEAIFDADSILPWRERYGASGRLFDVARVESTTASAERTIFSSCSPRNSAPIGGLASPSGVISTIS